MTTPQTGIVHMWHQELGKGDPMVLLHPAGVDSRAFTPNFDGLSQQFHLYAPDRRGHGRTPDVEGPISFELMAQDTIVFLETVVGGPAFLAGYSDGAVVALLVALRRPDLVRRLVFAAGVFHRDGWADGVLDHDETPPDFMRDTYAEVSPDGAGHYGTVVAKIAAEHKHEPSLTPADLRQITSRTLILVGDDDEVRLEHALELYRSLPDAELAIVPGTSHGVLAEKPDLCNLLITDFLGKDPVPTFAPIRRKSLS
ncbi:MAG: alpha/beta fold hydrolase [Nocardia sp.]|uniref:alpha/beta fold hydrolase n=1 Tax=Nocardia sp. TaxID=1821 RepID=UPI002615C59C|nr:alpha/beta hydrolase [Nocardia sp.]MCU1647698.1 alpha/beta fold hydrolase [Nocardia sp.]